jgi:hypothetical protein
MRWDSGACTCSKKVLPRATRNEERGRLLNATKGQLRDVKRSEREAALLERSTASLGQPICKQDPDLGLLCVSLGLIGRLGKRMCNAPLGAMARLEQ